MLFKDAVTSDRMVFLDLDEFAEECILDGAAVHAVIQTTPRDRYDATGERAPIDIFERVVTVYYRSEEAELPPAGKRIEFNDERWTVQKAEEQQGISVLELKAVDS